MQRKQKKENRRYSGKEGWLTVDKTKLNKFDFTLFKDPVTRRQMHQINWFVYRSPRVRAIVHGYINQPELHHRTNVLFRNLEIDGPHRAEFDNYKHDKVVDMYHCHTIDGQPTYVVMWEVDEKNHIINIVDVGTHENFNYRPDHNKANAIAEAMKAKDTDESYQNHVRRGLATT